MFPPPPLEAIEVDIRGLETEIMQMLVEVTGSRWQLGSSNQKRRHLWTGAYLCGYRPEQGSDKMIYTCIQVM